MIVVIGGLQVTGKSTLAAALGHRLGALVIQRDVVEASLWRSNITAEIGSRRAADGLLLALAESAEEQGRGIVLDSVFGAAAQRQAISDIAARCRASLCFIESVCSDEAVHRSRIVGRNRAIDGWYELAWVDVQSTRSRYEPWSEERLVVDGVQPLATNLDLVVNYVALARR